MSKYQKALDNIIISSCPIAIRSKEPCSSCKINKTCNSLAKDWVDTLQELIDKETPVKEEALDIIKQRINTIRLNTKIGSRTIADKENAVLLDNIEYNLNKLHEVAKTDYFIVDRMGVSEVDGDFLKATREKLHLSQTTFASIIGVKVKTLIKWEKGKKEINNTAKSFVKILNNFPLVFYSVYNVKKGEY